MQPFLLGPVWNSVARTDDRPVRATDLQWVNLPFLFHYLIVTDYFL